MILYRTHVLIRDGSLFEKHYGPYFIVARNIEELENLVKNYVISHYPDVILPHIELDYFEFISKEGGDQNCLIIGPREKKAGRGPQKTSDLKKDISSINKAVKHIEDYTKEDLERISRRVVMRAHEEERKHLNNSDGIFNDPLSDYHKHNAAAVKFADEMRLNIVTGQCFQKEVEKPGLFNTITDQTKIKWTGSLFECEKIVVYHNLETFVLYRENKSEPFKCREFIVDVKNNTSDDMYLQNESTWGLRKHEILDEGIDFSSNEDEKTFEQCQEDLGYVIELADNEIGHIELDDVFTKIKERWNL